jgi:CRP/FNR family transcriptional regulator
LDGTKSKEEMMNEGIKVVVKTFFERYPFVQHDKGQILLRPEESLRHIFFLVKGQVVEYDISPVGNEVIVNAFKPGAFFPMSLAVNDVCNNYFFEAATSVAMRRAPVGDAVAFLKDNPAVSYDLLRRVYLGTDGLLRRMAHMMGGKAQSRLVFELLNAAARFGVKAGNSVYLPLTGNDMSKRTGLSRETISRTMGELKKNRLVVLQPGGISLPDVSALEKIIGNKL